MVLFHCIYMLREEEEEEEEVRKGEMQEKDREMVREYRKRSERGEEEVEESGREKNWWMKER